MPTLPFLKRVIEKTPKAYRLAKNFRDGKLFSKGLSKNIRGKGNKVSMAGTTIMRNCGIEIVGNDNEVHIGGKAILNNVKIYINGNGCAIHILNDVLFRGSGMIWVEDNHGTVVIGRHSTFEEVHLAVTEDNSNLTIGEDCMFANSIDVRTGDSHSIVNATTKERLNHAKDVLVGDHVWVASHVSILKGSQIPSNSIVATRAVTTSAFERENVLLGGIPAKILKENVNWLRERI